MPNLLPDARTLSDAKGEFSFDVDAQGLGKSPMKFSQNFSGEVSLEILNLRGELLKSEIVTAANVKTSAKTLCGSLPRGVYVAVINQQGKRTLFGKMNADQQFRGGQGGPNHGFHDHG